MPKSKQQPAKKRGRPAKKKVNPIGKPLHQVTLSNYEVGFKPIQATNKDTEVECLTAMCSILSNFTQDQRNRTLQFLVGKYYDFS